MYLLIRILVSIQKLFSCFCCHFNINAASTLKWAYLHFTKHYKFLETHRKSKVCTSRKRESKRGLLTGLNSISNSSKKHHQCFLKKYLFSTILSKAQKKASHKALAMLHLEDCIRFLSSANGNTAPTHTRAVTSLQPAAELLLMHFLQRRLTCHTWQLAHFLAQVALCWNHNMIVHAYASVWKQHIDAHISNDLFWIKGKW